MARGMITLAGAALALVLATAASDPADAARGGGHVGGMHFGGGGMHWGGGGHFRAMRFGGMHAGPRFFHAGPRFHANPRFFHSGARFHFRPRFVHHRFFHRRFRRNVFFFGVGAPFYGAYDYGNGCYWLRSRALYTGSSYWWSRYYACVGYY